MKLSIVLIFLSFFLASAAPQSPFSWQAQNFNGLPFGIQSKPMKPAPGGALTLEAPTGFDNKSNGVVDDATHQADLAKFDEVEQLSDGLGPLYNAQSCRECHQSPVSGGASQVTELRVGHLGPDKRFRNPDVPIAHGAEVISGRSLVNDRAICPSAAFPNTEIQE